MVFLIIYVDNILLIGNEFEMLLMSILNIHLIPMFCIGFSIFMR